MALSNITPLQIRQNIRDTELSLKRAHRALSSLADLIKQGFGEVANDDRPGSAMHSAGR